MAKKRRRRSGRGGPGKFGWIGGLIRGAGLLIFKIFPIFFLIFMGAGLLMGVKQFLYADSNLVVQNVVVEPPTALTIESRAKLESDLLGKNVLRVNLQTVSNDALIVEQGFYFYGIVFDDFPGIEMIKGFAVVPAFF